MNKILLYLILYLFWSLNASAYVINDKVYLNACGSNPQEYKTDPLNIHNVIIEVPNKIISLEKSKYDRPIETLATSFLKFNGENYQITVSNFRDLLIKNERNEILVERKISGASSVYELKHQDKVVAWGVGWNKYCGEGGYENLVDFSVLRIFTPTIKNNKVEIQQKVLSINTSKTYSSLKPSDNFVISAAEKLWGYRNEGFYRDHEFYELTESDGLQFIIQLENLKEKVDIFRLNPHDTAILLAKYRQRNALEKFTKNNFEEIHKDITSRLDLINYEDDLEKIRKTCFSGKEFSSINEIAENCYILPNWIKETPIIFQRWLSHYARLEDPNKFLLGENKSDLEDVIGLIVPDLEIDLWNEGEKISLKEEVLASITHPENFQLKSLNKDRYITSLKGCMYQFCSQKIFILFGFDVMGLLRTKNINGEEDWVFFSRYHNSYSDLPKNFFNEVLTWQKEASTYENEIKTPNRIRFINGNNEIEDIQNFNPDTLGKPWIGIGIQNDNLGVLIPSVDKGSPAEKSGLMKKDIIIAFNNEEVKNIDDLNRIKFKHEVGDEITLKIMRSNKVIEKKLILGDVPRD